MIRIDSSNSQFHEKGLVEICQYCFLIGTHECTGVIGEIVYNNNKLKVYQTPGSKYKLNTQHLSLLCRIYLPTKTVYFDTSLFQFYLFYVNDTFIGYFSKEINSIEGYILSCILVLPEFQRQGFGLVMIEFAYELARMAKIVGGPEEPLSVSGKRAFFCYWRKVLLDVMLENQCSLTLGELSSVTGIRQQDILYTLSQMGFLRKYHNGIVISKQMVQDYIKQHHIILERKIDVTRIRNWFSNYP